MIQKVRRGNKYGAIRTDVDGQVFDSKAEANRFVQLRLMERGGLIRDLTTQPSWDLIVKGTKVGVFTGDFRYVQCEKGKPERLIIEDVKSPVTAKGEAYRLRVRLWKTIYPGIEFREVMK